MFADMSFLQLALGASLPVQLVMIILLLASLFSWAVIYIKYRVLKSARRDADSFEDHFWSSEDLSPLYTRITGKRYQASGMEKIFEAGFKEFAKLRGQKGIDPDAILEGAQRAMRVATNRETEYLETNLSFLATVGSTSPYIGLFGTVWGIMSSFQALGNVHQATISMVAPGISEALIATAMGLFAAIPAVVAFNHFAHRIDRISSRFESFMEEFTNILQRQASA